MLHSWSNIIKSYTQVEKKSQQIELKFDSSMLEILVDTVFARMKNNIKCSF